MVTEFLIALQYHFSKDYDLWKKGYIDDYKASTGIFIRAQDANAALEWSREISRNLLNYVNDRDDLTLEEFQHENWIVLNPEESVWARRLKFFSACGAGRVSKNGSNDLAGLFALA